MTKHLFPCFTKGWTLFQLINRIIAQAVRLINQLPITMAIREHFKLCL